MRLATFRRVLASVLLLVALAWLILGPARFPAGRIVADFQVIPSALAVTLGATAFWTAGTFLFGRVYCSTVCPVGTLLDLTRWTRRRLTGSASPSRFIPPNNVRYTMLWIYLGTLVIGWLPLAFLIEPWNVMRNAAATVRPEDVSTTWLTLRGLGSGGWGSLLPGVLIGMCAGVLSLAGIIVWGWRAGREWCNTVCPIGTAMGAATPLTLFHIEIDPDRCTACMKCEEVCPAGCIKVVSRYVDNSRCVRCFECIDACKDDAVRFQPDRNRRPASPLMRKVKGTPGA